MSEIKTCVESFIENNNLYAESFEKIADMYMEYRGYEKEDNRRFKMLKGFIMFQIEFYASHNKELFLVAGNKEVK